MAAGLGFKTFTTGEVLTAGDTNGYLMQGVLVFASSAARASAITSPQEGQYSYLKDTNSTEYYDGAAWVASGGSGALTFITSATAANTAQTLSINNCFSSAYVNYLILSDLEAATGNENFTFKLRVSGTDSSTGYHYAGFWASSASAALNAIAGANQTSFTLRDIGPEKALHTLEISNPFAAIDTTILTKGIQSYTGSNVEAAVILGSHDVDTSYDGFSLISGTSNLTGTVRVYGYSNS